MSGWGNQGQQGWGQQGQGGWGQQGQGQGGWGNQGQGQGQGGWGNQGQGQGGWGQQAQGQGGWGQQGQQQQGQQGQGQGSWGQQGQQQGQQPINLPQNLFNPNQDYIIVTAIDPSKALDVSQGNDSSKNKIILWQKHGSKNQRYKFKAVGNGRYQIYSGLGGTV